MSQKGTFADLDLRLKKLEEDIETLRLRDAETRTYVKGHKESYERFLTRLAEAIQSPKEAPQ